MPQEDHGFVARIGDQTRVARCVMLASGVVDTVPPVPGIAEAIMRDLVRVCPICDGYEARGRRVAVLGAGDYAAREALFLRTFAFDVSLVLAPEGRLSGALATRLREVGVGVRRSSLAEITVGHAAVTTVDAQTVR
jgi:thioredoxin reductase (NADPH)